MGSEVGGVEERLMSFWGQLLIEYGILDRIVYKNKNQHRRCFYFQHLLKVRRDLRLLQSVKLEEILNFCFLVIHGKRPKQKLQLLESLKRRRCDGGKYNFLERLLGVACLLSQMVEPMLETAVFPFCGVFDCVYWNYAEWCSFGNSWILLDVVCVYNTISSVSQKELAIKVNEEGIWGILSYEGAIYLLRLHLADRTVCITQKMNESEPKSQGKDGGKDASQGAFAVQYQNIEVLLGGNDK